MPESFDFTLQTLPGQSGPATVKHILAALRDMHALVPIATFRFIENSPGALVYLYRFDLYDTRKWIQQVDFSVDRLDPFMTFSVSDPWKLSEFEPHRAVRNSVVDLMSQANVERIVYHGAN